MFNVRPDRRWFGFHVEPPQDPTGFRLNADDSVRDMLPGGLSPAFLGYDLGASAAMPGGTMFNVQPDQDLPGLHNFKPPEDALPGGTMFNVRPEQDFPGLHNFKPREETVPGFRINPNGSIRHDATPAARPGPNVGSSPFGVFDHQSPDANAFTAVGDGSPPPYLALARSLYNGLGQLPMLDGGEPAGMARIAPAFSSPPLSDAPSSAGTETGSHPFGARRLPYLAGDLGSSEGLRPLSASFSQTATALPMSGPLSPRPSFAGAISSENLAGADPATADALRVLPVSDGQQPWSSREVDPIIHVADGDSVAPTDDVKIAQQQETPKSKLRKDPSPGVVVVFPDGSTVVDPQSPTGKLMAPVADLSAVAEAGRETKEKFRALAVSPIAARLYLAAALGLNVGQGGTFDYQRRGNRITGYTHLQQFEKVSNLNVGLFAQQAGLTLEEVLDIAGLFARNFSGNADPSQPYGLSATQLKFITRGYQIGESGMFDKPPMR